MKTHGIPEQFWVVTRPTEFSTSEDICFPCTFEPADVAGAGRVEEGEIVGIYADEGRGAAVGCQAAGRLSRPSPGRGGRRGRRPRHGRPEGRGDLTARDLARSAVEAVANAVRQGEKAGFRHRLKGRISLGTSEVVELRNLTTVLG